MVFLEDLNLDLVNRFYDTLVTLNYCQNASGYNSKPGKLRLLRKAARMPHLAAKVIRYKSMIQSANFSERLSVCFN